MSNLSNIGFPVGNEDEFHDLIMKVVDLSREIVCPNGSYLVFSDVSGAELYVQAGRENSIIGINPHFSGKSRRTVFLTNEVERAESELDGAFHGWANATESEAGDYPFVFDVPDFYANGDIQLPKAYSIQLAAFTTGEFEIHESEEAYFQNQESDVKFASQSFIPSGLFNFGAEGGDQDITPPQAYGIFAGIIKDWELKTNEFTGEQFYWFLVDTLGGEVDVVADPILVAENPQNGGIINGQFWLSGKIID
jgi:hypothetical protein